MKDDELIHTTVITTTKSQDPKKLKTIDQAERITHICEELDKIIEQYEVDVVTAELPTGGGHSSSAVEGMSIAKTVVVAYSYCRDLELVPLTPTQVKKVTGDRTASKTKMQIWASRKYPQLRSQYRSTRARDGFSSKFEHVADALAGYEAAKTLGLLE